MVLPLEQKTLRGLAVPAIWIGELFDKLRGTGGAEIGFQIAAAQRVDPADPATSANRLALVETCRLALRNTLDLLGISTPEQM